jgi:DNA-binding transcriptional regulator YdaS (Cro superfamily)
MKNKHLIKASEILGSQAQLAKAIGVTQPTLNQWITGDRPVPIGRCTQIEQATNGEVTRKDLRPDDWQTIWPELDDAA